MTISIERLNILQQTFKATAKVSEAMEAEALNDAAAAFSELLAVREAQPVASTTKSNIDAVLSGVSTVIWPVRCFKGEIRVDLYTAPPALPANVIGRPATPDDSPYPATIAGGCLLAQAWADGYNVRNAVTAAPAPAPAVPDAITADNAPAIFEIAAQVERIGLSGAYGAYASGWNACRAAMLNHSGDSNEKAEPVSQGYTLPDEITTEQMYNLLLENGGMMSPLEAAMFAWDACRASAMKNTPEAASHLVPSVDNGNMQNTPSGFKLVPVEPTEAMINAGREIDSSPLNMSPHHRVELIYRAMLTEAPTPTKAAPAEPVSEPYKLPAELPPHENESYGSEDDCYKAGKVDGWNEYRAVMLASVSAPIAAALTSVITAMIDDHKVEFGSSSWEFNDNSGHEWLEKIRATLTTKAGE